MYQGASGSPRYSGDLVVVNKMVGSDPDSFDRDSMPDNPFLSDLTVFPLRPAAATLVTCLLELFFFSYFLSH